MALTYEQKKRRQTSIISVVITVILICAVFLAMVTSFFLQAENEAYETLHIQTKQIKDDLTLQLKSDKENLVTMSNFAAKLHADGESYSLMFDSFEPIGLFSRIGILTPECDFITKDGTVNLSDRMSFKEQADLGEHITGRTYSYSVPDEQVVRVSVPFGSDGRVAGIMYGIVKIEDINAKYTNMAKELDAQLFVYDKKTGKFIIDSINSDPGELSELETRKYNKGYSYEKLVNSDKGFTSFKSIRTGENLFIHYSIIEDFDWGIMLARYESQVFENTHKISYNLLATFALMIIILGIYINITLKRERSRTELNAKSSEIRKLLLEVNEKNGNITEAVRNINEFTKSLHAFFVDTDGEYYYYTKPDLVKKGLNSDDRNYFHGELFRYAANIHNSNNSTFGFMRIIPNSHLKESNQDLYKFLLDKGIKDVSFAIITERNNHVSILGVINPGKDTVARNLIEDVAVCFSIAMYNKKHLNKTVLAATTDSLTGALNRVSFKNDIMVFDRENPERFSCIYIDVNELHLRNNKYGHAAGDEMLIYIANTLKEIFYGHRVYRMGGDEFLVFASNTDSEQIKKNVKSFLKQLELKGYRVAIGTSFRSRNTDCEDMVREAEIRMYESKAQYYQNKKQLTVSESENENYVHVKTGIREIDTMISVLKEKYNGIYRVSLETDNAHRILMPSYLGYGEDEENFSKLYTRYIDKFVHPDFHRATMSFLNYDAIRRQIMEGKTPSITYKKSNGENVTLSVYRLDGDKGNVKDTLWVFAKDD